MQLQNLHITHIEPDNKNGNYIDKNYMLTLQSSQHGQLFYLNLSRPNTAKLLEKSQARLNDNMIRNSALVGSPYENLSGNLAFQDSHLTRLNNAFKYQPSAIFDIDELNFQTDGTNGQSIIDTVQPDTAYISMQDASHHVNQHTKEFSARFFQSYDLAAEVMQDQYDSHDWSVIHKTLDSSPHTTDAFKDKTQNDIKFAHFGCDAPMSEIAVNDSLLNQPVDRYQKLHLDKSISHTRNNSHNNALNHASAHQENTFLNQLTHEMNNLNHVNHKSAAHHFGLDK